ncbi:MAG: hypothetical protein MUF51_11310 [Vicinamibacteria bacterium]|jgi:hypothetical protein|nr:hypothetical protein [Vicinamibacteria bacterium]
MRKILMLFGLAITLSTGMAWAQANDAAEEPEAQPTPVRKIKVLQHPYEISSYYRSSQGSGYGYGFFGYDTRGNIAPTDRYRIASFYRSPQGGPQPVFGYGHVPVWQRRAPGARLASLYRHRIGTRGDMCLITPTFLAPIGPLSVAYFAER